MFLEVRRYSSQLGQKTLFLLKLGLILIENIGLVAPEVHPATRQI